MRYIFKDLFTMRSGRTVNITVWDGFHGEVKIVKNRIYKWLIQIENVSMCYPQQVQLKPGERMWIYKKDLCRDTDKYKFIHKNAMRKHPDNYDDLPF